MLRAARFTTGHVRLVGQEPAPSKCVFLSTSRVVRREMRDWVVTDEGDRWTVKLDVRDLGGHDTTFRGWSSTLATRVRVVIARLVVVYALPLHFHGRLGVLRSMFIPGALHGIEASFLAESSVRKLRSAFCRGSWSRRQPFAHVGAVLSLLDGPVGCDPAFCVVWFRFRQMRGYLAFGLRRFLGFIGCSRQLLRGPLVMGLHICFLRVLLRLGSLGVLMFLGGIGLACLCSVWLLALFSISGLPFLMLGVIRFPWVCVLGGVFGVVLFLMFLAPCSSLTLTMFGRDKALLRGVLVGCLEWFFVGKGQELSCALSVLWW